MSDVDPVKNQFSASMLGILQDNTEDDDDEEEILSANSPLGRYATEVGLADVVTADTSIPLLDSAAECLADLPEAEETDQMIATSTTERLVKFVTLRVVAANALSIQRLLDEDDMKRLILALTEDNESLWNLIGSKTFLLGLMIIIWVIGLIAFYFFTVSYILATVVVFLTLLASVPWLAFKFASHWLASILELFERCLATQRTCLRVARERLLVERGYTLIRGANLAHSDAEKIPEGSSLKSLRPAPALSRAAFESARRLTHSTRRLARSVGLGGLAALTDDAEFGEAFSLNLNLNDLANATDGFAPTALASMAALLQMHLSDILYRLLLTCACENSAHSGFVKLLRSVCSLKEEICKETELLEARLERHRRRNATDVDALLEEFLGSSCEASSMRRSLKSVASSMLTPLQAATRSLRLQAEALLVKAVLIEGQTASQCASALLAEVADLAMEARVYAVNAAACCDEIQTASKPQTPSTSPLTSAEPSTTEINTNTARPVLVVSSDTEPAVEDEFLEELVPADDSDVDIDEDSRTVGDSDEAARRAATRRVLGELDSVIFQRRRLFRQREQAARARRGLAPMDDEGDADYEDKRKTVLKDKNEGDEFPRVRCRRRIVWHGTLEGQGDGDGGAGMPNPSSAPATSAASSSLFAAAALAARHERGIQLSEEAFGDSGDECE